MTALNPRDAKACCTCKHWHPITESQGECRNPKMRWGVEYENIETKKRTYVEWWTTGCYATCPQYESS